MKFLSRNLEVMAGVRAVEGLITQREVGDDVAFDRCLEQRPLKPRGVAQVAALYAARGADPKPRKNIPPEPFTKRWALTEDPGARDGNGDGAGGKLAEVLSV